MNGRMARLTREVAVADPGLTKAGSLVPRISKRQVRRAYQKLPWNQRAQIAEVMRRVIHHADEVGRHASAMREHAAEKKRHEAAIRERAAQVKAHKASQTQPKRKETVMSEDQEQEKKEPVKLVADPLDSNFGRPVSATEFAEPRAKAVKPPEGDEGVGAGEETGSGEQTNKASDD